MSEASVVLAYDRMVARLNAPIPDDAEILTSTRADSRLLFAGTDLPASLVLTLLTVLAAENTLKEPPRSDEEWMQRLRGAAVQAFLFGWESRA